MFIAQANSWNSSHTDLSKYFIEKIKQRVDYEEIISNRHKTTNGFSLIAEISEVATLAQRRIKSVNRLISLINEAKSNQIPSSIANDYILQVHHPDIISYYLNFNTNKLKENGKELSELLNKSKINLIRLRKEYYLNILNEFNKIDFSSDQFNRKVPIIDKLIDCLIPYLLFQGYSTTSISDVAYRLMRSRSGGQSPIQLIRAFNGLQKSYIFLIKAEEHTDEFNELKQYLDSKETKYNKINIESIQDNIFEDFTISEAESLYIIEHSTIDPYNYLRSIYDITLKNFVTSKNRLSLQFFNNFFDSVYWRSDGKLGKFQKTNLSIDPINVAKRKSTLRDTLITLNQAYELNFLEHDSIPNIKGIGDSLYYYNLALGSKSIENSLSLLWTSLETLLPYRLKDNDIENVQYFVSKSLSIGTIGREITAFAKRFLSTHWINNSPFNNLGLYTNYLNYSPEGIKKWIDWLSSNYEDPALTDPYDCLKPVSNLLCRHFCFLNDTYTGKSSEQKAVSYWLEKINSSEVSIAYQLDRIYLHRNQIVHSGKFINEYSNLWNHLEWYVGKLLSYCVIEYIKSPNKADFNKAELFMKLEADADAMKNILEINKDKTIKEIYFSHSLISKHSWQFF